MIVHFITPLANLNENISSLRTVIDTVQKNDHTLSRDWIEAAYGRIESGHKIDEKTWQSVVDDDFGAIAKADVIIAEVSYDSTAVGYQIATAINQKKPTLLLVEKGKNIPYFTWNIPSNFISRLEYDKTTLEDIVASFLRDNDIGIKDLRFNFFIDRAIYNYLRWAALKSGNTKAEVLRDLVRREIEQKDY